MSQRHTSPSSQSLQRSSASGLLPHGDSRSDTLRNVNGKRPRDRFQEDQSETPRKVTRLNDDHHSESKECEQLPNPITNDPIPNREQHFTSGPGHIIYIDEGGKRCPAICFNKQLLNIFNQIAEFSREVLEGDKSTQKARLELELIKASNQSAALKEAKLAVAEAIESQEDIEARIPGLMEARRQHETLTHENKWSKLKLDNSRAVAQIIIEQILNHENLLNIPSSKPQEPATASDNHLRAEPAPVAEKSVDDTPHSDDGGSGSSESAQSPTTATPDQQLTPRQLALRDLRFAAQDLDYRKGDFAFLQEDYAQAIAATRSHRRERHPHRPASTTQTDVDLQILRKTQQATRKLIEAEEAYERAEAHAEDLGLGDILADPHACYYGEVYNDFQPRDERSVADFSVNRARIEAWMAGVPVSAVVGSTREGEGEFVEVDEWEAESVEVFESVSLVAYDMYRKKIDRWQEFAGRLREGGVGGASLGTCALKFSEKLAR